MSLLITLAISLALTLLFELAFALLTGKRADLLLVLLVNVLTNPAVVLLYTLSQQYTPLHAIAVKAVLEVLAVLTEALYYRHYASAIKRPFLFSLAANAVSFGLGLVINYL